MNFAEYMNEQRSINRWTVLKIALIGAFCGACVAIVFGLGGFTV